MNILISGCNGFVGQNLLASLKETHSIYALAKIKQVPTPPIRTSISWSELTNKDLNEVDAIIHLAGKAHDLKKASNPDEYFQVNTELTKKLFDLFLESQVRDFIYFSSVKAVADQVKGALSESANPTPKTPYGSSKLKAEEYMLSKPLPEEKRLIILRPCMIHGPGNKGNLNLLYQVVKKGVPYPLAAFTNTRSFLSIDNLVFVIEHFLKNPEIAGGIYNVADDEPLSTSEVIKIMAKANNTTPKLWTVSPKLIDYAAKVGDILHLPLNSERLKKLTESYVVNNTKIKDALNIKALPVSSREGLFATIKSFQN